MSSVLCMPCLTSNRDMQLGPLQKAGNLTGKNISHSLSLKSDFSIYTENCQNAGTHLLLILELLRSIYFLAGGIN